MKAVVFYESSTDVAALAPAHVPAGQPDVPGDVGPGRDGAFNSDLRAATAVRPPRDRQHHRTDAERLR